MRAFWTPEAEQDREDIWASIATDDPMAAARMDQLFSDTVARLEEFPQLGPAGRIAGTRELIPHESYRLVYELAPDQESLWILALVHTSRQWP